MMTTETETSLTTLQDRATDIPVELTQDEICSRLMLLDYMKERIRAAEEAMKAGIKLWMEANQVEEFNIGTVKYYLATEKKTKCRNVTKALEAIIMALGGDPKALGASVDDIGLQLASDAWKQGACKKLLPPAKFEELFETTEKIDLHVTGAKAARTLQKLDETFVK